MQRVVDELVSRARTGDGAAFEELIEPYRAELLVHCYRMLGSFHDAEDTLQESLLAAWRGLGGFEGNASLRTWLYRITTNRCLNARRSTSRRQPAAWALPGVEPPRPTGRGEIVWLEPLPDTVFDEAVDRSLDPEARYEQTESISLAFVTALQTLPPRQLAALVLRDVLGFGTVEVANLLDTSVDSVRGALKRARATLRCRTGPAGGERTPIAGSTARDATVNDFVRAWESADVPALVALLTDDVFVSMPPMPFEYHGRQAAVGFITSIFRAGRRFDLVPTRANRQPAFGAYLRDPEGLRPGTGLYVLHVRGDQINALTHFPRSMLASFGLPESLGPGPRR